MTLRALLTPNDPFPPWLIFFSLFPRGIFVPSLAITVLDVLRIKSAVLSS